jgi:hypothetical protein
VTRLRTDPVVSFQHDWGRPPLVSRVALLTASVCNLPDLSLKSLGS